VLSRQARDTDRCPTSDARLFAEDITEQVGDSVCHEMDVVEIRRRDDEVQGSDDGGDVIQIANGEPHPSECVQPCLACCGVPLLDREIPTQHAGVDDCTVGELGEVSAQVEHAPDQVVRFDGSVLEAGVPIPREVLEVEPELADARLGVNGPSWSHPLAHRGPDHQRDGTVPRDRHRQRPEE
jgi:hypothetical protein